MGAVDAVLQDDDERPGSEKIRLLSGGEIFFRDEPSLEAGPARGTRRIFFAMALADLGGRTGFTVA